MNKRREISLVGAVAFCAVVILLSKLLKIENTEAKDSGKPNIPGL